MRGVLRLAKNIALSNLSDLSFPYRITHILTYRCQFRCIMCDIWRKIPEGELSIDEIAGFYGINNSFLWVNLSGGEIFLRADLMDVIKVISGSCRDMVLLDFPTNGFQTGLIVRTIEEIINMRRGFKTIVTVSLDGPPEVHDRIRNVAGSWDRALETFRQLRRLKGRRFDVFLGMTLQDANLDMFDETLLSVQEQIAGVTCNDFHINVAHRSSHYYGNNTFSGCEHKKELWGQLERIMKMRTSGFLSPVAFLERRYQGLARYFLEKQKMPVPCQALSASFFLDPAGTVYPCSIYNHPVGDVRDFGYDLEKLWLSRKRHQARAEIRKGNCPGCWTPCEAYQSMLASLVA